MDARTTSLAPANSLRGEWARFGTFLKRPHLPDRAPMPNGANLAATLRMLGLDFLVMFALLAIAGAVMSVGIELPETALAGMELEASLVVFAVLVAPLMEEIAFRGWLSGRPGHVWGLIAGAVAGLAAITLAGQLGSIDQQGLAGVATAAGIGLSVGLFTALIFVFVLRKRNAMPWFQRIFPVFFWLSTLGFACIHLFNFEEGNFALLLPLVLPQFATGAILGYVRVHYGLWSCVLLHALHNGAFISLVLLASSAAS